MKNNVAINRGEVVGIGKLKVFPSQIFSYEIPMLSFIVVKEAPDSYVATCIQLQLDGYGYNPERASEDMRKNCISFLSDNFNDVRAKDKAWDNLHSLFSGPVNEMWDAYRAVQLNLAESGVSTDAVGWFIDRIADLEKQVATLKAMKEKVTIGDQEIKAEIVDYQEAA
jgi:hypothetical protein